MWSVNNYVVWCVYMYISQNSVVLHSYNAHNDYVLSRVSFNCLHGEFYTKQIYDMLDELQVSMYSSYCVVTHCVLAVGSGKGSAWILQCYYMCDTWFRSPFVHA